MLLYNMNSFYYYLYEHVRREDRCVGFLNVWKQLQAYILSNIELLHIYFTKRLVWKDLGIPDFGVSTAIMLSRRYLL